ncbi:ARG83 [Candida oxycetoniae]|uniref:ARG83 n=1 Tax=Candida oxycetoniae TaxID=497107 RepID=A0AAI9WXV7_9ASCO|nr:ARG83 [Candida oxycetoniae]KAI3404633.2 ARG83 [Candida oxycetoniae]
MPRKARTFDGCWTLGWGNPISVSEKDNSMISLDSGDDLNNFQRRSIELMKFPKNMHYETYQRLNEVVEEVDHSVFETGRAHVGPFRCFHFKRDVERSRERGEKGNKMQEKDEDEDEEEDEEEEGKEEKNAKGNEKEKGFASTFSRRFNSVTPIQCHMTPLEKKTGAIARNVHVHFDFLKYAALTIFAIKGPDFEINEQNMMHILYPNFFPNIDSDDNWLASARLVIGKLFTRENVNDDNKNNKNNNNNNCSLILRPLFNKLLNAFSSDLILIDRMGFHNDYIDLLLIPYIKQIVGQFICWDFAAWNVDALQEAEELSVVELMHSINLCIVFLTLGLSAFKLSKRTISNGDDGSGYTIDEYLRISIKLRKLSIKLLNYHLDEFDSISELQKHSKEMGSYDTSLLLTLVLQIELDSVFSVFENFDLIYAIGDLVIKTKFERTRRMETVNKLLINIFKIKYFMYEGTQSVNIYNFQIDKNDVQYHYKDLDDDYDLINLESEDDEEEDEDEEEEEEGDDNGEEEEEEEEDEDGVEEEEEEEGFSSHSKGLHVRPTIQDMVANTNEVDSLTYIPTAYTINFDTNKDYVAAYEVTADGASGHSPKIKFRPYLQTKFTSLFDADLIYLMYGLPRDLLHIFHESIHIANHKNIFDHRKVFPRNFPRITAEVEDKLVSWHHTKSNWNLDATNVFHEFLINHINSFHQAAIICHHKLMEKDFRAEKYSYLVDNCLDFLSRASELATTILKIEFRPMFWILLMCGSIATISSQQERIKSIWSTKCFSNQPNYWRAKQILYEIWHRRAEGEEESKLGFMNIIREWNIFLSLGSLQHYRAERDSGAILSSEAILSSSLQHYRAERDSGAILSSEAILSSSFQHYRAERDSIALLNSEAILSSLLQHYLAQPVLLHYLASLDSVAR